MASRERRDDALDETLQACNPAKDQKKGRVLTHKPVIGLACLGPVPCSLGRFRCTTGIGW